MLLSAGPLFAPLCWHKDSCGWKPDGRSKPTWPKIKKKKKNLVYFFKARKVAQSGSVPGHADSFTGTTEWKELFGMEWK